MLTTACIHMYIYIYIHAKTIIFQEAGFLKHRVLILQYYFQEKVTHLSRQNFISCCLISQVGLHFAKLSRFVRTDISNLWLEGQIFSKYGKL